MIALARFIMAGPSQATLVIVAMAMLAFIIPPLAWISAAAVALVVLQLGAQRGLQVIGLASVAGMALSWLVLGSPVMVFGLILLLWLPMWLVALVLRNTVSLRLALQLVTGLGVICVLLLQLAFPQLDAELAKDFSSMFEQVVAQQPDEVSRQHLREALDSVLRMLPAIMAAGVMLSTAIGLVLGRWWQSVLYNPGGFAREFNQLRLGKGLAAITTALLALALLVDVPLLVMLVVVLLTIYLIQGLALVHGIIEVKRWNRGWLFGLYLGLFLLPHVVVLPISVFGLTDAWIDFRRRLATN
jgi:hypothetical protein